ncbi:MAG: hypothetical protein KDA89_20305, partial [Planctomycetaceae bacterium]|nr:hypothetical protein [Planctomycetaceae bacterium]
PRGGAWLHRSCLSEKRPDWSCSRLLDIPNRMAGVLERQETPAAFAVHRVFDREGSSPGRTWFLTFLRGRRHWPSAGSPGSGSTSESGGGVEFEWGSRRV